MSMEQNKRHTFDAYCKRLVKNEAVNIHLEYARQGKREAVFSELTQRELQSLCCTDRYAPERRVFTVLDMDFEIEDADLVRALAALTLERRSIVLLAYLLEMKDDEIAQRLQMNRSPVQYCTGTGYLRNRDRAGWPWISWETLGYALETAIFRREKFKMKNQFSFILSVKISLFYQCTKQGKKV